MGACGFASGHSTIFSRVKDHGLAVARPAYPGHRPGDARTNDRDDRGHDGSERTVYEPFTVLDLPVSDALPALHAALAAGANAVLVAPPGAGKTTVVPLALLDLPGGEIGVS